MAEPEAASGSSNQPVPVGAVGGDEEVTIAFQHAFFSKLGMAYFRLEDNTGNPVLMVEYGEQVVALPLAGVRRELELPSDHPDARMLELIEKGLKYVQTLSVGDPLPSEILTGKASWSLTPQHAQIAYQKLAMKLLNWMTGSKSAAEAATADEVLNQFKDPETRKKIAAAFGEAAEALGLGRDHREEVVTYLETLAQELGYIEALRDRFGRVVKVGRRLRELQELAKKGQRISDVIDQAAKLMRPATEQFVKLFKDADAVSADIMKVLKDLDGTIAAIRTQRDEIHQRLNPWNDLLDAWEKHKDGEVNGVTIELSSRTVRLLAPRFMPTKEWVLRFKEEKNRTAKVKSWRSPEQQREEMNKVAGKIMRW